MIGTPLLGHMPLDTHLSFLCDFGSIEDYQSEAFDRITDLVIESVSNKEESVAEEV